MLREYIVSEAMHNLNIKTTRSLAILNTGQKIQRETYEEGGILDDLIIYHANNKFRLVSNCSTREQNRQWFEKHAIEFGVKIIERSDMGILAIQGPDALNKILEIKKVIQEHLNH